MLKKLHLFQIMNVVFLLELKKQIYLISFIYYY